MAHSCTNVDFAVKCIANVYISQLKFFLAIWDLANVKKIIVNNTSQHSSFFLLPQIYQIWIKMVDKHQFFLCSTVTHMIFMTFPVWPLTFMTFSVCVHHMYLNVCYNIVYFRYDSLFRYRLINVGYFSLWWSRTPPTTVVWWRWR